MNFRVRVQLEEAFGSVNCYYCSQAHGYPVDDKKLLLTYFVRSGGAADFARRFNEAMSNDNRWFCAQFYRRMVDDPPILWTYYNRHRHGGPRGRGSAGPGGKTDCQPGPMDHSGPQEYLT